MLKQKVQNANSRSERLWGQVCTQTRHTIDPHAASWHQRTVPWSCGLATIGPERSNASCESRVKPLQWLNSTQLWGGHFRPICPHRSFSSLAFKLWLFFYFFWSAITASLNISSNNKFENIIKISIVNLWEISQSQTYLKFLIITVQNIQYNLSLYISDAE